MMSLWLFISCLVALVVAQIEVNLIGGWIVTVYVHYSTHFQTDNHIHSSLSQHAILDAMDHH